MCVYVQRDGLLTVTDIIDSLYINQSKNGNAQKIILSIYTTIPNGTGTQLPVPNVFLNIIFSLVVFHLSQQDIKHKLIISIFFFLIFFLVNNNYLKKYIIIIDTE